MIDERHLDELLREAGEELDRLAADHNVARREWVATRQGRKPWLPILAATVAAVVGVAGVVLIRIERAAAPGNRADVSVSSATTQPAPVDTVVYVVRQGDFLAGIAAEYGVTMDAIVGLNGWVDGLNHPIVPGEEVRIPANAALPYLMLGESTAGYVATESWSGASGKDFDPPAFLLGWRDPAADGQRLVPVVVSPQWMDALPDARDVDDGEVSGWIATLDFVTVGSFHVDGMSATVRVESAGTPDADIVALVAGLPPSDEVEWGGAAGPPEGFVEIARQAEDSFVHVTAYADEEGGHLSFGTVTDYPLNGLTLEGEPTVSQVLVGGLPAFVLRTTTGVTSATLYWPCGVDYRCMVGHTGTGPGPSDAQLVALAQHSRPATPAEIDRFEEM